MKVYTHFAGSTCTVFKNEHMQHHQAWYIDARNDVRKPHLQMIELVHAGKVKAVYTTTRDDAPDTIVALMRNNFYPL